ncbi:MAG: trypsin-like peptidase domain-containing protein [Planctomycetia bacterium]|nr:trypsin-like peptidase domain-containing protein [Planctomycetia bacterium]
MSHDWYFKVGGEVRGPVSAGELLEKAAIGEILPDTPICKGVDGGWGPAAKVQGLFQGSGSTPAPPPTLALPLPPSLGSIPSSATGAAGDASEKPERIWPVTWAAIIVGSGTVLLLLWALVFRGGSAPQQQAKVDQPAHEQIEGRAIGGKENPIAQQPPPAASEGPVGQQTDTPPASRVNREPAGQDMFSSTELYRHVSPSVVSIDNYDIHDKLAASGSGFFVSGDGHVVTNLHVIQGAHKVTVRLHNGTTMPACSVVGFDSTNDLAVLAVTGSGYSYLQLSTGKTEVGTRVYAIGDPMGLSSSMSDGIISGRPELDGVSYIQTTAPISPGSSGGPLVTSDGTAIGITSASLRGGQNLNLAIPAIAITNLLDKKQQPLSLAELNVRVEGTQGQQLTIEDDPVKLSAVWKEIQTNRLGDALTMMSEIPNTRRGSGFWIANGHVHFKLNNIGEAQSAFGKAVANNPNNTEALLRLALAWRFDHSSSDSWSIAVAMCRRVVTIDPTNVPAHIVLGISSADQGRRVGFFKTAVALDPEDFSAQYNLGVELLHHNEVKDAIQPLEVALRLEKKLDLGDYLFIDAVWPVSSLSTSSTTKSFQVPLKLALAYAYSNSNQYERAVKVYKEVLAVERNNPVAPWGLCFTYRVWRKDFKHPDALLWEKRAEGMDFMPAAHTDGYMPTIVYKYFGMFGGAKP